MFQMSWNTVTGEPPVAWVPLKVSTVAPAAGKPVSSGTGVGVAPPEPEVVWPRMNLIARDSAWASPMSEVWPR